MGTKLVVIGAAFFAGIIAHYGFDVVVLPIQGKVLLGLAGVFTTLGVGFYRS